MRNLNYIFILLLYSYSAIAKDCSLSSDNKNRLINESPYFVDDVRCRNDVPEWIISNRRVVLKSKVVPVMVPKVQSRQHATQAVKEKKPTRRISFVSGLEGWNVSASYGAKFLSVSQSGSLSKAEMGTLFLNNMTIHSEFIFEKWSFGFQLDSYKFKYESLNSGGSKPMYKLNLYSSYNWFIAGLSIEENPLFRNNAGSIEMTKMALMNLSVGIKKDIELPTRKPTTLKLKGLFHYPLSSLSNNTNVKLDSIKGFGVATQAELDRLIFAKKDYSLHATWITQLGFYKLTQDVKWDASQGEVKSSITSTSTSLGLLMKF